jgi:hypothetical protein
VLHPAEHRGYRELAVAARRLAVRWERLHPRLPSEAGGEALRAGAVEAGELLAEVAPLIALRDLHVAPGAQGLGATLGLGRANVLDRFLELNQALRLANGELRSVLSLLVYLGAVARSRDEEDLAGVCERWHERLSGRAESLDAALVALGSDPDRAVEPVDPSPAGRAAHGVGFVVGSLGEWSDRRAARRP